MSNSQQSRPKGHGKGGGKSGGRGFQPGSKQQTPRGISFQDHSVTKPKASLLFEDKFALVQEISSLEKSIPKIASKRDYQFLTLKLNAFMEDTKNENVSQFLSIAYTDATDIIDPPVPPRDTTKSEDFQFFPELLQEFLRNKYKEEVRQYRKELKDHETLINSRNANLKRVSNLFEASFEKTYLLGFKGDNGQSLYTNHEYGKLLEAMRDDYESLRENRASELSNLINNTMMMNPKTSTALTTYLYLEFWVAKFVETGSARPSQAVLKVAYGHVLARSASQYPSLQRVKDRFATNCSTMEGKRSTLKDIVSTLDVVEEEVNYDQAIKNARDHDSEVIAEALKKEKAKVAAAAAAAKVNNANVNPKAPGGGKANPRDKKKQGKNGEKPPKGDDEPIGSSRTSKPVGHQPNKSFFEGMAAAYAAQQYSHQQQMGHAQQPFQQLGYSQFQPPQRPHHLPPPYPAQAWHYQQQLYHQQSPQQLAWYNNGGGNGHQNGNDDNISLGNISVVSHGSGQNQQNGVSSFSINMHRADFKTSGTTVVSPEERTKLERIRNSLREGGPEGFVFWSLEEQQLYRNFMESAEFDPHLWPSAPTAVAPAASAPLPAAVNARLTSSARHGSAQGNSASSLHSPSAFHNGSLAGGLTLASSAQGNSASTLHSPSITNMLEFLIKEMKRLSLATDENTKAVTMSCAEMHKTNVRVDALQQSINSMVKNSETLNQNQKTLFTALVDLDKTVDSNLVATNSKLSILHDRTNDNTENLRLIRSYCDELRASVDDLQEQVNHIQISPSAITAAINDFSMHDDDPEGDFDDDASGNTSGRSSIPESTHAEVTQPDLISLMINPLRAAVVDQPFHSATDEATVQPHSAHVVQKQFQQHRSSHLHKALIAMATCDKRILDSGATHGIHKSAPSSAYDMQRAKDVSVNFGGNPQFALAATHTVKTNTSDQDLIIPDTKIDIVSISQADKKNLASLFYQGTGIIWDPSTGQILETATLIEGLYQADAQPRFKSIETDLSRFPRQ